MAYIFDLSDAWTGGAAFTAIKMNVTDGGSTAGSLLMDLQVGGVSLVRVNKSGHIKAVNRVLINSGASETGIQTDGADDILLKSANTFTAKAAATGFVVPSTSAFSFAASASATDVPDTILRRDAANTLAQRNGVNAQAFNLYNTYTDASNYERGFMRFVSNTLRIGTEQLGTGTARAIEFYTDGVKRLEILANGNVQAPNFVAATSLYFGATGQITSGRIRLLSPADGQALFHNGASNGFDRIMLGGTTSSFPAIKRDTTSLQARLADDSAFTNIQGKLTTDTAYTAGAPTATGYIVLFDSAGTAYKIPAEAL